MSEEKSEKGIKQLTEQIETIAKGASITFFGDFAGKGLAYLSQVVVARLLGVQLFGYYALGLTIYKFSSLMAQLGLNNGVLRFVPKLKNGTDDSAARGVVRSGLIISSLVGSLLAIGIYFGASWISNSIFKEPNLTGVLRSFSVGIPFFALMMIALYSTRSEKRMEYFVYVKNFQLQFSFLAFFLVSYLLGFRLYGATWSWVIATVAACLSSIFFLKNVFPKIIENYRPRKIRELLKFSLPLVLVGVLQFLILWTDTFMLGALSSAETVGLYRAAVQTALLLGMVLRAFNSIFAPIISDLYSKKRQETLDLLFKTITRWVFVLTAPLFAIIIVAGDSVLEIFGPAFPVVWLPLILLGLSQMLDASMGPVGYILIMSGNQKIEFYNVLFVALLNIALNFIMIPKLGTLGAALATGTSVICVNLIRLVAVTLRLKLWPYDRKFLKGIGAFAVSLSFGLLWRYFSPDWNYMLKIVSSSGIVLITYFGSIFLLGLEETDTMILNATKRLIQKSD